jgi:hypothetical protein
MFRFRLPLIVYVSGLLLTACAALPEYEGKLQVLTTSRSQALAGAECVVETAAGKWTLITPGNVTVGKPAGDLRIVCNKEGFRTSELVYRAGSGMGSTTRLGVGVGRGVGIGSGAGISLGMGFPLGGGRYDYPPRVVVDLTPLQ